MGEQGQRIFWLNGLAGTGKSTIAQTFAETTFADGKLGASFFCSRDFEERSNLKAIFPTLAFQLAYQYPLFRKELLQVLKAHPDAGWETLCSQMEKLIVGPLQVTHIPTLIIIDALDECPNTTGVPSAREEVLGIVNDLVDLRLPNLHTCVTSRPEADILTVLEPSTSRSISLHDHPGQKHDIAEYISSVVHNDIKMKAWRKDDKKLVIETLSQKADGM